MNDNNLKTEASKYIKHFEEAEKSKEDVIKIIHELLIKNIEHTRSFYTQLSGFSLLIIAAFLQILSSEKQTIISNSTMAFMGIIFLSISTLGIILYLTYLILSENQRLNDKKEFYLNTNEEQRNKSLTYIKEGKPFEEYEKQWIIDATEYSKQEKAFNKPRFLDKFSHLINWIISVSFIIGFILSSLALFIE